MANSEIGSSTRDTLGGEYQVFLSYRTRDTGPGFTDSLYHALVDAGIHVFLDNEEIRPGQSLTGKLLQALNDSKIYIPIFSNSYASSHWCLREFAKMVENTSKPQGGNMKVILPIYYDVTPYDVKLETELYIEAITELEKQMEEDQKKFRTEEVEKWRRALREFNDTKGLDLRDFKGDGHLSKSVVEEVVKRLWIKQRIVTKDLVGMEDRIEIINNLLDTNFGGEYQVYLSYSGFDTHRKFSNTLYHALVEAGIRVVTDYEELQEYGSAIDDSKIYIIIFSQMYLSNRWCLHQLVRMVENTSKSKEDEDRKLMLPIFYDAKLKDVKLKTKLYDDAILELEQINNSTEAKMWLQALKEDGGISGLNLKNYTGDGDLSKSVVNKVVDRLRKERSKDVQLVGIYGMTGIGKSTLAKIIFNQQYPHFGKYCSFLDDVSKTAKTKGLVELQKQLLSDISNSRVARNIEKIDHGIHMIGETICSKKVLIVLDDVDDVNQIQELIALNSLCPGTRILVTTRNKTVLKIRGFKYEIVPYEMEGLSDEDALQLFSRHAFDSYPPPDNYDALSKGIVSTAGGLPLALEAIGSSLFLQKDKKIWEEKLEKLRKTPNRNVLGNLRISYDALEMDQRQIFLDIACFFIDENKTDPIYMWRDCGFSPEDAIDVLISRCMIKVINNKFRMHNQFRDFGRAIANQERSRLWTTYDIISELISTEIKGSVQALCLQMDLSTQPPITVTWKQIQRFPHLRFLRCSNVTFQGKFTGCLSKLKWFSYRYPGIYPSLQGQRHPRFEATNLHLENVHVVNLFGLGLIDDEVSSLIKGASKLKVLTLQESDLQTLEGLPSNLTVLVLSRTRVKQVPLDGLAQLEKLTIEGCGLLERLSIPSNLRKLREVKVSSCTKLVEVQFLDVLRSMEILSIEDCKSFERLKNLKNLKDLSIKGCESLQFLTLQESNLQNLEGLPSNLTGLELSRIRVKQVPLDGLAQLEKLTIEGCELLGRLSIPSSLRKLREVKVSSCTALVEVQFLYVLRSMEILCIEDCKSIQRLKSLKNLKNLKDLSIKGCESLQVLTLQKHLQTLEGLPSNLTVLELSHTRVEQVTLEGLAQLEKLAVEGCELLVRLFIPSSLRKLREVKVSSCTKLVAVQFFYVLISMEILRIEDCKSITWLKNLKNLKNLKDLSIKGCESLQVLTLQESDLQTLEGLPSNLTVLELSRTRVKQVPLDGLAQLEKLIVEGCEFLERLSIPSDLRKLREVKVSSCTELVEVQFLDVLRSMEILCIEDCKSFESLKNLKKLKNLKDLSIKGCESLQSLTFQESDLQTLQGLPSNLTVLELSRTRVKQVPLDGLAQLEKLTIEACELLGRLSIPSSLRKLREVKVSSCTELVEVQFLYVLRSMEILCIEDCKSFEELKNLKKLKNLKDLSIKGCEILQVIEGIDELEFLQRLKVKGCGSIRRIIDASSSTIPNECEISITDCGELLDTGRDGSSTTWESYSEKILKRPIQGSDSKTEAGDPLLKTNQQNKEEKK